MPTTRITSSDPGAESGWGGGLDSPWYWANKGNTKGPRSFPGPGAPGGLPTGLPGQWRSGGSSTTGFEGGMSSGPMGSDPVMQWRRLQALRAGRPVQQGPQQFMQQSIGQPPALGSSRGRYGGGGRNRNPWAPPTPEPPFPDAPPSYGDPNAPAFGPGTPGQDYDPRYWNAIGTGAGDIKDFNRFIAQFIHGYSPAGGPFAVGGDPNVRSFIDSTMQRNARGMQGQALTAAQLAGADPAQRNWMNMQALMGGQAAGANALSQYAAASNTANDDLRRSFLDALHASNLGLQRQNNQGAWQQIMANMQRMSPWDYLAGMGGQVAGGWLRPGGLFPGNAGGN